jgi:glycosyltransferase involved in cell wall biosynthesis
MGVATNKILLIENFSIDFVNARLKYANYLKSKGFEVFIAVPDSISNDKLSSSEFKVHNYNLKRQNKGFLQIFKLIFDFFNLYKSNNINIVHSYRFQPNIINVLSNLFTKNQVVIHITGLGSAFSGTTVRSKILKYISLGIYFFIFFRADKIVLQNYDDQNDLYLNLFWKKKAHVVLGSGVDINDFNSSRFNSSELRAKFKFDNDCVIFTCVTRLLKEKGVIELVKGFEIFNKKNPNSILIIVGWVDFHNPNALDPLFIEKYSNSDKIRFVGKSNLVHEYLALSDIFIYPSYYREGIPRAILEAMSMSLPIITTNMPGCNLTVKSNGFLIEPKSISAIVEVLNKISKIDNLQIFGFNSRSMVSNMFSTDIIYNKLFHLYDKNEI